MTLSNHESHSLNVTLSNHESHSLNFDFFIYIQLLPDISHWKYYTSKKHASEVGCGLPVQDENKTRKKVDTALLEHFIDYILLSDIVKDLPYGMKTMRLSTGEIVEIPNMIRSLASSSLITQYLQFCDAEEVQHLGMCIFMQL